MSNQKLDEQRFAPRPIMDGEEKEYLRIKHSIFVDLVMGILTGGFWLIWMFIRPKYKK